MPSKQWKMFSRKCFHITTKHWKTFSFLEKVFHGKGFLENIFRPKQTEPYFHLPLNRKIVTALIQRKFRTNLQGNKRRVHLEKKEISHSFGLSSPQCSPQYYYYNKADRVCTKHKP